MSQIQASTGVRRGVVAVIVRDARLLVIRRSQFVRSPGMHCFPGGTIETGEAEPAALIREMLEELAVGAVPVRLLWRNTTANRVELAWWMTRLDPAAHFTPLAAEVESFQWLLPEELCQLPDLLPSNLEFMSAWQLGRFEIDELPRSSAPVVQHTAK